VGVHEVVRDAAPLGDGELGGADVHAAVDLHRVGVDHLAAQALGEVEGEPGLAGRGRPDDGDDRRGLRHGASLGDMSFLDKFKAKAQKAVDDHGDKIAQGIDKAATAADQKTKGKYSQHITTGRSKAKEALDKLDGKKDGDVK
jgi:hypothetical protein